MHKKEKYYPLKRNIPKFQAKDLLNLKTDKQQLTLQLNPTSIKHQNQIVNPQEETYQNSKPKTY